MSFSTNTDASVNADFTSLSVYGSVIDNSSGCYHSSYTTTVTITSPSGRVASGQASGLGAYANLALNGEFGAYSILTHLGYYCSCVHATVGYSLPESTIVYPPANLHKVGDEYQFTEIGQYKRKVNRQIVDSRGLPWTQIGYMNGYYLEVRDGCNMGTRSAWSGYSAPNGQWFEWYDVNIERCKPEGGNHTDCTTEVQENVWFPILNVELPGFPVVYSCTDVETAK